MTWRLAEALDDRLTLVDGAGLMLDVEALPEIERCAADAARALRRKDRAVARVLTGADAMTLVSEVRLTRSGRRLGWRMAMAVPRRPWPTRRWPASSSRRTVLADAQK